MRYIFLLALAAVRLAADINSTVYIPQVVDGGGWQTTFTIVNLATLSRAQGTIHLWAEDGTALALPIAGMSGPQSSISVDVPPRGVVTVSTAGSTDGSTTIGWADFDAATPQVIGVSAVMRQRVAGRPDNEVVVPSRKSATTSQIFVFDGTQTPNGWYNTGFGMMNASRLGASRVDVTVRNDQGVVIQTFPVDLPRGTHTSFSLFDNYPVTKGQRGTVEFNAQPGGYFAVIGLRFNPTGPVTNLEVMTP
jgi:hypothetical protein